MILGLIDEAVAAGARQSSACEIVGIDARTVQRWRRQGVGEDGRTGPRSTPANKLLPAEEQRILGLMNRPCYRDLSPKQLVPMLADQGLYLASESTIYRLLRRAGQQKHRGPARPPRRRPKERVATGPNQVWSWDITYVPTPVRGLFYYLYLVVDVWSRKIVGWSVHECESGEHASRLLAAACRREGVNRTGLVLHQDNGSPMKASTLLAKMQELQVTLSYSRPRVSNDNPYSESLFRTLKYRPSYPRDAFASLEAAREWVASFVAWYNTEHRHSSIRMVTPEERHSGLEVEVLDRRAALYEKARRQHPERWSGRTRDWTPVTTVRLNPEYQGSAAHEAA
jgi:transposase InsO family protein